MVNGFGFLGTCLYEPLLNPLKFQHLIILSFLIFVLTGLVILRTAKNYENQKKIKEKGIRIDDLPIV